MIQTWIADVTPLMNTTDNTIYTQYLCKLPTWRREKATRFKSIADKALSVGAWTLYEQANAKYGQIQTFNLSHSGKYALCSFLCNRKILYYTKTLRGRRTRLIGRTLGAESLRADSLFPAKVCKIGCDVQRVKEVKDSLAKRFFTENEHTYVMQGKTKQERNERICRLWALKESFAKATGEGLRIGLANFDVGFDEMNRPVLLEQPKQAQEVYYFREYSLENESYQIAVCASVNQFADAIEVVKLDVRL